VDLIEVDRIDRAIENNGQPFLDKVFTEAEQSYCKPRKRSNEHFAVRFAAKEAVLKALGLGWSAVDWTTIEVVKNEDGAPFVEIRDDADLDSQLVENSRIHCSLSHYGEYGLAFVILEQGGTQEDGNDLRAFLDG